MVARLSVAPLPSVSPVSFRSSPDSVSGNTGLARKSKREGAEVLRQRTFNWLEAINAQGVDAEVPVEMLCGNAAKLHQDEGRASDVSFGTVAEVAKLESLANTYGKIKSPAAGCGGLTALFNPLVFSQFSHQGAGN